MTAESVVVASHVVLATFIIHLSLFDQGLLLEQGKMVVENAEPGERLAQIMALLNRAVRALQLRFASQARQDYDSLMASGYDPVQFMHVFDPWWRLRHVGSG
jgi:hypothetical protein